MPRFFVRSDAIYVDGGDKLITITGDDASHITRSLRMTAGEIIDVCDMSRRRYHCEIVTAGDVVTARVIMETAAENEPPYRATVYQCLAKGDKFDTVVQKSVECGASLIVPVLSERCTVRTDAAGAEKKRVRWQRIAKEASMQCGRDEPCGVATMMSFNEALDAASRADIPLFCYEGDGTRSLRDILEEADVSDKNEPTISVFIGPEGGFSVDEAASAGEKMHLCGLGRRILRTETASSFVLACLSYKFEL